jgi:phthalate 4,5-dioxygenase oxygenase subunit
MLSQEDNELLTRVGPGTPMGRLLREYWIPAVSVDEIEADGRPYRVRLLGENLAAFRDSNGRPGVVADNCPHRGASLFFGRNEEGGLRCVYHGWKFDVSGACVDMPNEPAESNFKDKVRARAYPAHEEGGIVWIYMGTRSDPPPMPRLEWLTVPADQHRRAWRAIRECNWVQAMEGELDTSHAPFLHGALAIGGTVAGGTYRNQDKAPRLEMVETDYGVMYGARRDEGPDHYYWRTTQYMMPFFTCFPATLDGEIPCHMWVPIDDENTMVWLESWNPLRSFTPEEHSGRSGSGASSTELYWPNNGVGEFKPAEGGGAYQGWWAKLNQDNDFGVDREVQRTRTFTGIPTVPLQDAAMTVSMGRISNRAIEHLGTADGMIIQVRRRLLRAVRALQEAGTAPPGVDAPELYRVRSASAIFRRDISWADAFRDWHHAEAGLTPADESSRFLTR